jgi:citrate synthase
MEKWRTAIARSDSTGIWIRGYDVTALMRGTFTDTIYLLHRGRLPTAGERDLLDAILVGVSDHGAGAPSCAAARLAASGNRQSLSAAIAAGVLAIGDDHGGAGEGCMVLIDAAVAEARRDGISVEDAAARTVDRAVQQHTRLPGLGHRVHTTDPRVAVLFEMARQHGIAGDGVTFVTALERAARERIKPLPLNIDGALAAILHDLGFEPPAGKFIFIVGRVAGLTAEVAEEHLRERPMRIRIPVEYDGEPPRRPEQG